MAELKGTRTEANLQTAFAGECHGTQQVHVLCLQGEEGRLCADRDTLRGDRRTTRRSTRKSGSSCSTAALTDTAANLKAAAEGENYEWTDMYATVRQGGP